MKNFISKNWKKILYTITGILMVIDLFFIVTSPATISQDFLKYGPDIKGDVIDSSENLTDKIEEPSTSGEIIQQIADDTGFSPDLVKGILIFGIALVLILALSGIIDGSSSDKKKK